MWWRGFICASVIAVVTLCEGCVGDSSSVRGGNVVRVLLDSGYGGAWPAGLDPATNTTARSNLSMMNAIYGGLFQMVTNEDGTNPRVEGVLAEDYQVGDEGRRVVLRLREGVRFSDGTPLDAEAVKFNIERDLESPCTCSPSSWPWVEDEPVRVLDELTVELRFSRPYGAVINALPVSNINWIASPTALAEMGEGEFKIKPVGAGPFKIVSNQMSSRLVLQRNDDYWQDGRPYLDGLIFQSIGSEQAGYQALLAGDADVYEGVASLLIAELAENEEDIEVTYQPATSPYVIQLNTFRPPFDSLRAREAIYYATDVDSIIEGIFGGHFERSQSFTGRGGLFHQPEIPGYRPFDIEKARLAVDQLGGLQVELGTIRTFVSEQILTALQSQWERAGIEVTIETHELAGLIQDFRAGDWQALLQTSGSYDPEAGSGVNLRFHSAGTYTGVRDGELDALLEAAAATFDLEQRRAVYLEAGKRISENAYAPFLFAPSRAQLSVKGLRGPGLTTRIPPILVFSGILWQDVRWEAQ